MYRRVYTTANFPVNIRAAIAKATIQTAVWKSDSKVTRAQRKRSKVLWSKRARLPKGVIYLPDDGPFSRAVWGAIRKKAMMARVKHGYGRRGRVTVRSTLIQPP